MFQNKATELSDCNQALILWPFLDHKLPLLSLVPGNKDNHDRGTLASFTGNLAARVAACSWIFGGRQTGHIVLQSSMYLLEGVFAHHFDRMLSRICS